MTAARPPQNRARQRPYHRHGQGLVTKAIPYLVERVKDPALRDDALTPVERGARAWRTEVVQDLGGPEAIPAARTALVDAALGTKIVLDSLDRYLFELAAQGGLVNRRNRRAFAIVADRMRVADSLTRHSPPSAWTGRSAPRRTWRPTWPSATRAPAPPASRLIPEANGEGMLRRPGGVRLTHSPRPHRLTSSPLGSSQRGSTCP